MCVGSSEHTAQCRAGERYLSVEGTSQIRAGTRARLVRCLGYEMKGGLHLRTVQTQRCWELQRNPDVCCPLLVMPQNDTSFLCPQRSLTSPRWRSSKESACNAGHPGSIPGSGRSPGEGNGYPLQDSCLENPTDRGAWRATLHGVAESDTTEQLTLHPQSWMEGSHLTSFEGQVLLLPLWKPQFLHP